MIQKIKRNLFTNTWYIFNTYRKNKPQVCLTRDLTQTQREFIKTAQFRKLGMWEEYTKGVEKTWE